MNPHTNQPYTEEDLKQCPFQKHKTPDSPFKEKITMQSQSELPENQSTLDQTCPFKDNVDENLNEEEQMHGGCPMMQVSSKKRNPALFVPEPVFAEPYVSPFHEFLGQSLMFNFARKNAKTEQWSNYPIFLKNSIFYHTETFNKYRGLEIGYKFFITDEMKEKANEEYNNGNIDTAINMIEKALSCLRWLECKPDEIPRFKAPNLNDIKKSIKDKQLNNQETDDLLKEEKDNMFETLNSSDTKNKDFDDFFDNTMNRLMFTTFNDENVTLHDKEGIKSTGDHDMYDNILFNLYNNMIAYYLKGNYLVEAKQTLLELEKINTSNSMTLFRKAQIALADSTSSIEQLQEAYENIKTASESKKNEKLFQQNQIFLKTFNLSNHEQVYLQLEQKIDQIIKLRISERKEQFRKILRRAKEIQEAEEDIIKRGLVPQESPESNYLMFYKTENIEMTILDNMLDKYRKVVEFYSSGEEKKQVSAGKKGYQYILELRNNFLQLWNIEFSQLSEIDQSIVNDLVLVDDCR